jgi:hypothetical protein
MVLLTLLVLVVRLAAAAEEEHRGFSSHDYQDSRAAEEERARLPLGSSQASHAGDLVRDYRAATRLVYNRVGKAGSSELTQLLKNLSKRNGLEIRAGEKFNPTSEKLLSELRSLPKNGVYHNHAGCVASQLEKQLSGSSGGPGGGGAAPNYHPSTRGSTWSASRSTDPSRSSTTL